MKNIYQIHENTVEKVSKISSNFWVDLIHPTEEEIKEVSASLQLKESNIKKVLDKSELPHIEYEKDSTLYIIHIPYLITTNKKKYRTYPLGIFFLENGILTVSLNDHPIREDILNHIANHIPFKSSKTYPIYLIGKSVEYFLKYINEIQDDISQKEKTLIKSTSNKDLENMLTLQKSLLYFTTSLQGNRVLLEKIENNEKLTPNDFDLLKDELIEIKQAIEMTNIYREILENTMNTYSSIISNNLNDIMKFLTSITLVISIPTMISSFLGMNVFLGDFGKNPYSFLFMIVLSTFITIVVIIILKKKNLL